MSLGLLTASTVSVTGGTAQTFTPDGESVKNGIHLIDASVSDFRVRPSITVKYISPKLLSDGTYTKGKMSATYVVPYILENGKTVFNLSRCEIEIHPECMATVLSDFQKKGAQIFCDTDLANFWLAGSLTF